MKQLLSLVAFFAFLGIVSAQVPPQGINFQGVARNANQSPKVNITIQLDFKIWDAPTGGNVLYYEKQTASTNGVGLFTTVIGNGAAQPGSGTFSNINWAVGQKYLEVIVEGESSARQLMVSVPYALYAEKAKISYASVQQGTNFSASTTVRGASWNDVKQSDVMPIMQLEVPSTGTYLVLANLKLTNAAPSDEEFQFRVLLVNTNGELLTESTVFQKSSNLVAIEKGELSSWTIVQLTEGNLIRLQQRMVVGNNNEPAFSYTHGKLALIKLQ